MDFGLTPEQQAFQASLRDYFDSHDYAEVLREMAIDENDNGPAGREFLRRMGRDGWLGIGWPKEFGGGGRSAVDQWLYLEEVAWRFLPNGGLTVKSIGPTIARIGTDEQKRQYLGGILAGEIDFAVGYSEPNSGTDVASLRTRAVRQGEQYVINGQKIYTTMAHYASHIWLAARTGEPGGRKHEGISIIVVPMDSPGITVRPLHTQSGGRTNEVFFDDVKVPVTARIGEEGGGWKVMMTALDFERTPPYSGVRRALEHLADWALQAPAGEPAPIANASVRTRLADAVAQLATARAFSLRSASAMAAGRVPTIEASSLKVYTSELRQRVARLALDVMGEEGQQAQAEPQAPSDGSFEHLYLVAPVYKFAAGANEIQRDIIAQRGLGLPKAEAASTARREQRGEAGA